MATRKAPAEVDDWQTVQADDWHTTPATPRTAPASVNLPPSFGSDTFKAAVHSQMLGIDPGLAYSGRQQIDTELRAQGGDYDQPLDDSVMNDIKVGLQGSIFGLMKRNKLPDEVSNPGVVDKLITGTTQTIADLPWMIAGGVAGGAAGTEVPIVGNVVGAGAGAFAIPGVLREALVQGIKGGKVTSFKDLMKRTAAVTWAGAKGAAVGAVTEIAGGIPVGSLIAKSSAASIVTKGLYQATAMTTAGDLLDGHIPNAKDFAANAALVVPLNLLTHGVALKFGDTHTAVQDRYVQDGTHPEVQAAQMAAQPPVKPDMPAGLRPAIQFGEGHTEGEAGETHDALVSRSLAKNTVTLEQLEADPAKADRVLENPKIHEQDVIDRAWQLKKEAVDAGEVRAQKPLYEMSQDEIETERKEATGRDKSDLVSIFGEDGAKKYSQLQRAANNGIDMQRADRAYEQIQEMESGLNKAQQDKLFGVGDTRHQLEEINEYDSALGRIDGSSPEALSTSLKWAVSQIDDPSKPVEQMNPKQQVRYAQLRHAFEIAQAKGWNTEGIIKDAVKSAAERFADPNDAMMMLEKVARSVATSEGSQPALPGAVEAPKPLRIEDLYDRNAMKSGRGFVTPDGEFLSRKAAKGWMRDNEPDVHDMWLRENGDDKSAELHTEAYAEARNRTQNLNMAKGDPTISNVSPENTNRLAAARDGLNKIKAGLESEKYGKEVLRTLFAGQRDARVAATTQVRDSIKSLIPDYRDQEALSILRDYKGTPQKLAADLAEIQAGDSERMKALVPSIERAMNPSPELLQADQKLTDYYTGALDEGRQFGFLDSTIDPSHYSPHLLTRILEGEQPKGGGKGGVMSQNTPFAQERNYPTIIDAMKTERLDAKTLNAVDSLSVYGDRHATVVATKILATELKNTDLGKYGTRDNHPDGWVKLAPGNDNLTSGAESLYVPQNVADAMKPLFESGLKGTAFSPLLVAQGYVKSLELGLSLFHMKALSITAMNNMSLADFTKALVADVKSPEFAAAERGWAADSLTTSKTTTPYEAYKGLEKSSVPTGFDKLANAPGIKQLDALFKKTTEVTFDVIQRKFKVQDAELKAASWMAKHPDATNEEYFTARRSIAKEVNSAYGGLNWDVLGTGKTVRDVSRLFLLAPDWTFSNVLTSKYAFEGGPAGSAARMFWAKSFATGFAMTAAASIAIGGKYDPTDIKHLDQVYMGTDKDGKEMYADWFFAGAPRDAMSLVKRVVSDSPIAGTAQFIAGKASPLLGTGMGLSSNKQGNGKPIYNRDDDNVDQTIDQAKYAAGRIVPITGVSAVKTVSDALTDPEHEYSYTDLLGLAADAIGSPTIHEGSGNTVGSSKRTASRGGSKRYKIR